MTTTTLETLRRAIADLLVQAFVVVLLFASTSLVHWLANWLAGSIEAGTAIRSTLHFFDLTLFGLNAFVSVSVLAIGAWKIFRAFFSEDRSGAE